MLPVVHLHQPMQRANGGRCASIAGVDRLRSDRSAASRELLPFELLEQVSEDVQIARRRVRAMQRALDASSAAARRSRTWMAEGDLQRALRCRPTAT